MATSSQPRDRAGARAAAADPGDHRRHGGRATADVGDRPEEEVAQGSVTASGATLAVASARDPSGRPVHRGWAAAASHHRWLEPFVLMALASGHSHGYAIVGALTEVGISGGSADVGQVYRTLRDLEQAGQITSTWATGHGAARRDYRVTGLGSAALDEWAAVMKERARLIAEFDATYLAWVFDHARPEPSAEGLGASPDLLANPAGDRA